MTVTLTYASDVCRKMDSIYHSTTGVSATLLPCSFFLILAHAHACAFSFGAPLQSHVAFFAPGAGARYGSRSQHTPYRPGPSPGRSGGATSTPLPHAHPNHHQHQHITHRSKIALIVTAYSSAHEQSGGNSCSFLPRVFCRSHG